MTNGTRHDNPYRPPGDTGSVIDDATVYYQSQSTKISVREYWRLSKTWGEFLFSVIFKTLRIPLKVPIAFANAGDFERLTPQELSPSVQENLKPLIDQAGELGLQYVFSYWLPMIATGEGATAVFSSPDGRFFLLIIHFSTWTPHVVNEKTVFSFVSLLAGDSVVATSDAKHELDGPSWIQGASHPGLPMRDVLKEHRIWLEGIDGSTIELVDSSGIEQAVRDYERRVFEFQFDRGVLATISQQKRAEVQELRNRNADQPQPQQKPFLIRTEWVCVAALVCQAFVLDDAPLVHLSEVLVRGALFMVPTGLLILIWITRIISNRRRKSGQTAEPNV